MKTTSASRDRQSSVAGSYQRLGLASSTLRVRLALLPVHGQGARRRKDYASRHVMGGTGKLPPDKVASTSKELAPTTTIPTATAARILVMDLGNYRSVLCDDHAGRGEVTFSTNDTTPLAVQKQLAKCQPVGVVIEACAVSGWVDDLCGELGLHCRVLFRCWAVPRTHQRWRDAAAERLSFERSDFQPLLQSLPGNASGV